MAGTGNWRESLHIPGVSHGANPIPAGTRIGNLVVSGGIMGSDPETGKLPEEADKQVENVFKNLANLMKAAGGSMDDVARVTVFAKDLSIRETINKEWLKYFADEHSRPSRHTQQVDLRGGMLIQLEVIGYLQNK
jgi:2-iminobutanoate/2-iminopropanoate deaminase